MGVYCNYSVFYGVQVSGDAGSRALWLEEQDYHTDEPDTLRCRHLSGDRSGAIAGIHVGFERARVDDEEFNSKILYRLYPRPKMTEVHIDGSYTRRLVFTKRQFSSSLPNLPDHLIRLECGHSHDHVYGYRIGGVHTEAEITADWIRIYGLTKDEYVPRLYVAGSGGHDDDFDFSMKEEEAEEDVFYSHYPPFPPSEDTTE